MTVLEWFAANKDALVAIAALVSPVVAVIGTVVGSVVSYRAVVTGPRIQREIAREQFALTSRQVALQERTLAANLLGAADQKWIEDWREAITELQGLISERGLILDAQKLSRDPSYRVDRVAEIGNRLGPLVAKIDLMVGPAAVN